MTGRRRRSTPPPQEETLFDLDELTAPASAAAEPTGRADATPPGAATQARAMAQARAERGRRQPNDPTAPPAAVFGPDRPRAAADAFGELRNAQAAYDQAPTGTDWRKPKAIEDRLKRAKADRAQYHEYGDSMFGGLGTGVEAAEAGSPNLHRPGLPQGEGTAHAQELARLEAGLTEAAARANTYAEAHTNTTHARAGRSYRPGMIVQAASGSKHIIDHVDEAGIVHTVGGHNFRAGDVTTGAAGTADTLTADEHDHNSRLRHEAGLPDASTMTGAELDQAIEEHIAEIHTEVQAELQDERQAGVEPAGKYAGQSDNDLRRALSDHGGATGRPQTPVSAQAVREISAELMGRGAPLASFRGTWYIPETDVPEPPKNLTAVRDLAPGDEFTMPDGHWRITGQPYPDKATGPAGNMTIPAEHIETGQTGTFTTHSSTRIALRKPADTPDTPPPPEPAATTLAAPPAETVPTPATPSPERTSVDATGTSAAELLDEVDLAARRLLMDVGSGDAEALLRGWPQVVNAAADLWQAAVPTQPGEGAGTTEPVVAADTRMDQIVAMAESITDSLHANAEDGWPRTGAPHPVMDSIVDQLQAATKAVRGPTNPATAASEAPTAADLAAGRQRIMHTLWVSTHAVGVALHDHGHELFLDAKLSGVPIPYARMHSRYAVPPVAEWIQRINNAEQIASSPATQTTQGPPAEGPTPGPVARTAQAAADPDRLKRALTAWDIQAHRTLAAEPTADNINLVARTQGFIAGAARTIITAQQTRDQTAGGSQSHDAEAAREAAMRMRALIDRSGAAWSDVASRWADLASVKTSPDTVLLGAALEVHAAATRITHVEGALAPPEKIATLPGLDHQAVAILHSMEAGADIAYVVAQNGRRSDLVGPAAQVSRRAHNDFEAGIRCNRSAGEDIVWVPTADILAKHEVPLPEPAAEGMRLSSTALVGTASRAGLASIPHRGEHPPAPHAAVKFAERGRDHPAGTPPPEVRPPSR